MIHQQLRAARNRGILPMAELEMENRKSLTLPHIFSTPWFRARNRRRGDPRDCTSSTMAASEDLSRACRGHLESTPAAPRKLCAALTIPRATMTRNTPRKLINFGARPMERSAWRLKSSADRGTARCTGSINATSCHFQSAEALGPIVFKLTQRRGHSAPGMIG